MSALATNPTPATHLPIPSIFFRTKTTLTTTSPNYKDAYTIELPPTSPLQVVASDQQSMSKWSPDGAFLLHKSGTSTGNLTISKYSESLENPPTVVSSIDLISTETVQASHFSPLSTYVITWERAIKPTTEVPNPPGNLKLFQVSDGSLLQSFYVKEAPTAQHWPAIQWTNDERLAFRKQSGSVAIHHGSGVIAFTADASTSIIKIVRIEGLSSVSVAPGPLYKFAAFTPEIKGKPAKCSIYQYPSHIDKPLTSKSFYQADEITVKWSPSGSSCILYTSTSLDTSGKSYYGSTGLHLLSSDGRDGNNDCIIPLPKEGPVHDVQWSPAVTAAGGAGGEQFIVISGSMPSQTALYNVKCDQLFTFGEKPRNTICFSPHGRFLAIAGFGNLAGTIDFWDVNKKKIIGTTDQAHCAITWEWSASGREFLVGVTAPRMNVDNHIKIFKYTGQILINHKIEAPDALFETAFRPCVQGIYPDRPMSPTRKGDPEAVKIVAAPVIGKYRPPGAGGGASFAERLRLEREGKSDSKVVSAASGTYKAAGGKAKGLVPGMPVGGGVEVMSKSQREKEKKRFKAEEAAKVKLAQQETEKALAGQKAEEGESKEEKEKRAKKLNKQLKQIAELRIKEKGGESLNEDQKKKLMAEEGLVRELREIGI